MSEYPNAEKYVTKEALQNADKETKQTWEFEARQCERVVSAFGQADDCFPTCPECGSRVFKMGDTYVDFRVPFVHSLRVQVTGPKERTYVECLGCGKRKKKGDFAKRDMPRDYVTEEYLSCVVKISDGEKIADCQNCKKSGVCSNQRAIKNMVAIEGTDKVKNPRDNAKVERKTMAVKGGEAWVEKTTYPTEILVLTRYLQRDSDGIIREKARLNASRGMTTGDCPECRQMPCKHTAKLLGWPEK
jgi:hypothetical protein